MLLWKNPEATPPAFSAAADSRGSTSEAAGLWSREAGGFGGSGENRHEFSPHGGDAGMLQKLAAIDRFHLSRLGRFLEFLKTTREAEGAMLDWTIVLYGSGMNSGQGGEHSPKNLPTLVAGGHRLGLKHGRHLGFSPDKHPALANLLLSLVQASKPTDSLIQRARCPG